MAQELISHKVLSLDFWQDTVTYAGSVMPTGTIGCAVLNIPDETITRLDAPCMILNQLLTGIGEMHVGGTGGPPKPRRSDQARKTERHTP